MTISDDPNRTKGKITLTVELVKNMLATRRTRWTIKLGLITGYGGSIAECKADFAAKLTRAVERLDTDPAFARDDDGSLIVAVQQSHGVVHWRVPREGGRPVPITGCDGPPRESLASVWHYTILGD